MRPAHRNFVGLLALVAMTLSLTEGIWASTCAPADEMAGMDMGTESMPMDHGGDAPADVPGDDSDCPLMPLGFAPSCAISASLPSGAPRVPFSALTAGPTPHHTVARHESAEPSLTYRPPRS